MEDKSKMTIRSKTFCERNISEIQEAINTWLSETQLDPSNLLHVKYNTTDSGKQTMSSSGKMHYAMIIYKEEAK